jgi:dUTP pyrophosphatase
MNYNQGHRRSYKMCIKEFAIKVVDIDNTSTTEFYTNHSTFHQGDAGLDLFIVSDIVVEPHTTVFVDLNIQCRSRYRKWWKFWCEDYEYYSYWLMPRSSISKTPLIMHNSIGLIDRDYTGNLKFAVYNTSDKPFMLKQGERYVQLVNGDLSSIKLKLTNENWNTTRGAGGFGSTGR